ALSEKDELREYLSSLQNCPSTKYTDAQWQITTALLSVLPLLVAELNVAFDEKNVSDFTEITLAAIRALGELDTPSELALILDYQIRHLLIDEFQDTSSTQARLLMHLTHGWENHDGRTLFLVGDPMQSIYRFREAEVGLFLKTQQEGLGNISLTPLFLKANFRSTPHIVDWINQHFAYIFPTVPDISSGAVTYNPSFSTKTEVPNSGVYIHACRNEQTPSIIDIIQKERHAFPENSIALLVRSRAHLLDIVPALKNARIAFTAVEIEALNHQPIVHDLLALTTALIHLSDRVAWLAILRAPWCGLTLHDLYAVAGQNHHLLLWEVLQTFNDLPNLSNDGKIRLSKVVPILALSIQQRQRLTLRTWITPTWKALNGPQCLQNEHEHAIADTFFTTLESLEIAGDLPDVAQLSQKINTQFATPQNISKHALHIMTIHKAKGLEFDTVIIPHLDRKNKNESERLLRWLDRPRAGGDNDLILAPIKPRDEKQDNIYRYLHLTETQKINYEMARLFYVATTRSKKNLHLLATINDDNKKPGKSSFLSLIPQVFEEKISPLTFESLSTIEQDAPIEKLFYRLPTNVMHGHYTHHQQDNSQNKVSQVSDKQDHVGALARKILQNISQTNIDSWTPEKILTEQASWKRWLSTKGIELCDLKASVEKVTHIITQTLSDPRGRWILAPKVEHATELTLSTITNRGLIHLVIDRTFIDDEGTRWIIDYKTDSPTRGENIEDFLNQRQSTYRNQLEMYASALAQMDNRPISLGIYFPAFCGWKAWSYEGPSASTSKLSAMS
ncbi:MAG: ATP-dependent nuclease subunit, partial [Gammaproteobacteria bacterium]|nr:ATP-dependent nuclease subunit [Gammaproteobacteria bacterium]